MFNQMRTTTPYTLLSAIGEYGQTDTLLPLEYFGQHTPLLHVLVYLYIATSHLLIRNESYTNQPYVKEYELHVHVYFTSIAGNATASLRICKKLLAWS